jgi:hypothetical protein
MGMFVIEEHIRRHKSSFGHMFRFHIELQFKILEQRSSLYFV